MDSFVPYSIFSNTDLWVINIQSGEEKTKCKVKGWVAEYLETEQSDLVEEANFEA